MRNSEKRIHERLNFKHHPVHLVKLDGAKILTYSSNISVGGIQVMTNRLSATVLSPLGPIKNEKAPIVDISITVPHDKGILKIVTKGKLVYIALDDLEVPTRNYNIGIRFIDYLRGSKEAIMKIINNEVNVYAVKQI